MTLHDAPKLLSLVSNIQFGSIVLLQPYHSPARYRPSTIIRVMYSLFSKVCVITTKLQTHIHLPKQAQTPYTLLYITLNSLYPSGQVPARMLDSKLRISLRNSTAVAVLFPHRIPLLLICFITTL